tara:strand:- start:58 stop:408 length:351 start_codon:yes stop_codon:yes gene_type:complete
MKLIEMTALVAVENGHMAEAFLFDYASEFGVTILDYSERPMAVVAEPDPEPEPKKSNYKGNSPKPGDDLLRRALALRAEGKLYREIADALDVHPTTAWTYVQQAEALETLDEEVAS